MKECFRIEWERVIKGRLLYVSLAIGIVTALLQVIFEVYPRAVNPLKLYSGRDGEPYSLYWYCMCMNQESVFNNIYKTIMPILAMLPHALSFHSDMKSGYVKSIYTRTNRFNYLMAKYVTVFVSGMIVTVIPYIINFVISACMLPALNPIKNGQFISGSRLFLGIFYNMPLLYICIYLVIDALFASAFASTALAVSYYIDNIFMLSMEPFILWYGLHILSRYIKIGRTTLGISPIEIVGMDSGFWTGYSWREWVIPIEFSVLMAITIFLYFRNGMKNDAL